MQPDTILFPLMFMWKIKGNMFVWQWQPQRENFNHTSHFDCACEFRPILFVCAKEISLQMRHTVGHTTLYHHTLLPSCQNHYVHYLFWRKTCMKSCSCIGKGQILIFLASQKIVLLLISRYSVYKLPIMLAVIMIAFTLSSCYSICLCSSLI